MGGRLIAHHPFEIAELQFVVFLSFSLLGLLFAFGAIPRLVPAAIARVVGFVAGYSYSLYLTHHTILEFLSVRLAGEVSDRSLFWIAIATANIVAVGFWYLFERHHRQLAGILKEFLAKRRRASTGPLA